MSFVFLITVHSQMFMEGFLQQVLSHQFHPFLQITYEVLGDFPSGYTASLF